MRVGLIDYDSHNFSNFPLMKISFYHKQLGNTVEFADMGTYYDVLYVSRIFTESKEPELPDYSVMLWGGSGYDLENRLPEEIEHCYPELTKDTVYIQSCYRFEEYEPYNRWVEKWMPVPTE